jgi:hypothetical protein
LRAEADVAEGPDPKINRGRANRTDGSAEWVCGSATADRRADRSRAAGRRDTGAMTTATTRIERSGPAVRAALAQLSPGECAQFEAEFAQATARAGAEYDLAPAQQVLDRWWGIAVIRANPLSDHEQAQLARAREGVFDGLWERDDHGDWHQL